MTVSLTYTFLILQCYLTSGFNIGLQFPMVNTYEVLEDLHKEASMHEV